MKTMDAGFFETNCLAVLNEMQTKRETVAITKCGKPAAKLAPMNVEADNIYNFMAGKGVVAGDVVHRSSETGSHDLARTRTRGSSLRIRA